VGSSLSDDAFRPSSGRHRYDQDWIFFIRRGTLLGQRFDLSQATISGEPAVVARRVGTFSTARSGGVIVYRAARVNDFAQLQWFDRAGVWVSTVPDRPG
jgi:hypothetical protein